MQTMQASISVIYLVRFFGELLLLQTPNDMNIASSIISSLEW